MLQARKKSTPSFLFVLIYSQSRQTLHPINRTHCQNSTTHRNECDSSELTENLTYTYTSMGGKTLFRRKQRLFFQLNYWLTYNYESSVCCFSIYTCVVWSKNVIFALSCLDLFTLDPTRTVCAICDFAFLLTVSFLTALKRPSVICQDDWKEWKRPMKIKDKRKLNTIYGKILNSLRTIRIIIYNRLWNVKITIVRLRN